MEGVEKENEFIIIGRLTTALYKLDIITNLREHELDDMLAVHFDTHEKAKTN